MMLKKEDPNKFATLNLAQTFFWITNHIAQVVDKESAMQNMDVMRRERDGSEPPIISALSKLQILKGDDGCIIIHRPRGGGTPIEIPGRGFGISSHFAKAEEELLLQVRLGHVELRGRKLGKPDLTSELIDSSKCEHILFLDVEGTGNHHPRAVNRDHHETYWDLISFKADQIFKIWPPNGLTEAGGIDLTQALIEAIAEKKKNGETLSQEDARQINANTGANFPRSKVRNILKSLEHLQGKRKRGRPPIA